MSSNMEVDPKEEEGTRIALHPLTIVHMSDQYTRISCGGSPLDRSAPVTGLLFGGPDEAGVLQIQDADDIPTEVSEVATTQVNLHRAVFPLHSVVGWYRVSCVEDDEPTPSDLQITQTLQQHYASTTTATSETSPFCFCLLQVENPQQPKAAVEEEDPSNAASGGSTFRDDLPITLYECRVVDGTPVLLGLSNWQLETSEPERIAVERVMKEQPEELAGVNPYVVQTKALQDSLLSMKDRVQILVQFVDQTQQGIIPPDYSLLRQVQGLLFCLGPLSVQAVSGGGVPTAAAGTAAQPTALQDAELLSHLAAVAKTVTAVQSYTDKFRVLHESKSRTKEMRRIF